MILLSSSGHLLNLIAIEDAPSTLPQLLAHTGFTGMRAETYPFRRMPAPASVPVEFLL